MSQISYFEMKVTPSKGIMGDVNPRWVAPEILRCLPYTKSSDVYSLGLLLWELKHRKMAYMGDEFRGAFMREHLRKTILSGARPPIDPDDEFDKICAACWREDPSRRPTAHEVVVGLNALAVKHSPSLAEAMHPLIARWERQLPSPNKGMSGSLFPTFQWSGMKYSTEDTRVTCSALAGSNLWFGGRNGKIGLFNIDDRTFLYADDDVLGEKSLVQSVVFMRASSTVWTACNSGDIFVWNASPIGGKIAAERVRWKGDVSKGVMRSGVMSVTRGLVIVEGTLISCVVPVRDITDVTLAGTSFSFSTRTESHKFFCTESELASQASQALKRCISYYRREKILLNVAHHCTTVDKKQVIPAVALIECDGKGWTLDGRLFVTSWNLQESRGSYSLMPSQTFDLNSISKSGGCLPYPVGIWKVTNSEMWVGLGGHFVRMGRAAERDGSEYLVRDLLRNQWGDIPAGVREKDLQIMCACVVECVNGSGMLGLEVWMSTVAGLIFVWSVSACEVVRCLRMGAMVSSMVAMHDEVGKDEERGGDIFRYLVENTFMN